MNIIDYICPSILLVVVGYFAYRYVVDRKEVNKTVKIYTDYKNILESKLIPLGFERQKEYTDVREKEVSYNRNNLKITLRTEPPFSYNAIYAISGKKITAEQKVNQMPPEIRNKTKFLKEEDKQSLVDALDFEIELSESEVVKEQFLQTLDKWLSENR